MIKALIAIFSVIISTAISGYPHPLVLIAFYLSYFVMVSLFVVFGIPKVSDKVLGIINRAYIKSIYSYASSQAINKWIISSIFSSVGVVLDTGIISLVIGNDSNSVHLDLKIPVLAIVVNSVFASDLIFLYIQVNRVRKLVYGRLMDEIKATRRGD